MMAWCRPGYKSLSEPMVVSLAMHICHYVSLGLNELNYHGVNLTGSNWWYVNIGLANGLVPSARQQAITYIEAGICLWSHMLSLDHNESNSPRSLITVCRVWQAGWVMASWIMASVKQVQQPIYNNNVIVDRPYKYFHMHWKIHIYNAVPW